MFSALPCLHVSALPGAVKCTPLSSPVVSGFFGTMGVSDFLLPLWIPIAFLWFGFHTLIQGSNRTSTVLCNTFIISLAKLSDWGMFPRPHHIGHGNVVCCEQYHIDHFQPHNNFPAQSLHFRFGSAAPCPTLKSGVTASIPRTRYRRVVSPYLTGFSCYVLPAYKGKQHLLARGNQLC